jgi:hypothetical protein
MQNNLSEHLAWLTSDLKNSQNKKFNFAPQNHSFVLESQKDEVANGLNRIYNFDCENNKQRLKQNCSLATLSEIGRIDLEVVRREANLSPLHQIPVVSNNNKSYQPSIVPSYNQSTNNQNSNKNQVHLQSNTKYNNQRNTIDDIDDSVFNEIDIDSIVEKEKKKRKEKLSPNSPMNIISNSNNNQNINPNINHISYNNNFNNNNNNNISIEFLKDQKMKLQSNLNKINEQIIQFLLDEVDRNSSTIVMLKEKRNIKENEIKNKELEISNALNNNNNNNNNNDSYNQQDIYYNQTTNNQSIKSYFNTENNNNFTNSWDDIPSALATRAQSIVPVTNTNNYNSYNDNNNDCNRDNPTCGCGK